MISLHWATIITAGAALITAICSMAGVLNTRGTVKNELRPQIKEIRENGNGNGNGNGHTPDASANERA